MQRTKRYNIRKSIRKSGSFPENESKKTNNRTFTSTYTLCSLFRLQLNKMTKFILLKIKDIFLLTWLKQLQGTIVHESTKEIYFNVIAKLIYKFQEPFYTINTKFITTSFSLENYGVVSSASCCFFVVVIKYSLIKSFMKLFEIWKQ